MTASYVLVQLLILMRMLSTGASFSMKTLTMDYYAMRCPFAETTVRNTVNQALWSDPTLAAGLVRMHFHDCFVEGCDGSILIDSTKDNTAEKDSPANLSLRGYEVIDQAKHMMENQCPGVVSCADIVAMAARDAVFWTGGPFYDIPKGRKDGTRSKIEDTINLPAPTSNSTALIEMFSQRGFTVQDLVALAGAHTLGTARCASFKNRLSNFDSTHDVDPALEPNFAGNLIKQCSGGDASEAPFDWTRNTFDNAYYHGLETGLGLLTSDQTLFASPQTRGLVDEYSMNQGQFFFDFQQAMVKMGVIDVKDEEQGQIRLDCRKIN